MALGGKLGILCSATGAKEFPSIKSQNNGSNGSLTASKTITFPAGIVAGDLILVIVGSYTDSGLSTALPAGYTSAIASSVGRINLRAFWKIASGGETSVTFTNAINFYFAYDVFVLGGAQSVEGAAVTAGSGAPNPPSLSPSWGSDSNLWIACETQYSTIAAQSAPSGYINFGQVVNNNGADTPRTAWATRQIATSTEDPGAFGASASISSIAGTLAVRPL